MGADGIKQLLSLVDLAANQKELDEAMGTTRSKQIRKKLAKRLKLVQGFATSRTCTNVRLSIGMYAFASASPKSLMREDISRMRE